MLGGGVLRASLVFACLAACLLASCSGADDSAGTDSTVATSDGASGAPSSSGEPTSSEEGFPALTPFPPHLAQKITEIKATVSEIRGLPVPIVEGEGYISVDDLAQYSLDQYEGLADAEEEDIDAFFRLLRMLGLAPDDYVFEDYASDEAEGVAGVYFIKANRLVLISEEAPETLSTWEETVIAHEITHAMQNSTFDLEKYAETWTDHEQDKEGYTAYEEMLRCVIEGDATFTQFKYAEAVFGSDWREQIQADLPDDAGEPSLPVFLQQLTNFNYGECQTFMESLYEESGWDAINDLYEHPPATQEQVLDFEKFQDGEIASRRAPDPLEEELPGWTEGPYAGQFGAYDIFAYIYALTPEGDPLGDLGGLSGLQGYLAGEGWGSGWIRDYTDPDDGERTVIQISFSFDSQTDLQEFLNAFAPIAENFGAPVDAFGSSDLENAEDSFDIDIGKLLSAIKPGDTFQWSDGPAAAPFGLIAVDDRLPEVDIFVATDADALALATSD